MQLDHFAVATPSLDVAADEFAQRTGIRPSAGGSHPGKGTRNALVSLGPQLYLAIDGPDPAQPLVGNTGAWMRELIQPLANVYVVRTDDIELAMKGLEKLGYSCEIERLNRLRPNGAEVAWLSLVVRGHDFGRAMPIITQWLTSDHPERDAPQGCRLETFLVRHPEAVALSAVFSQIGLSIAVTPAAEAGLHLSIRGSRGAVQFT